MKYLYKSFTLPASSGKTTSKLKWDLAFLPASEFQDKYGLSRAEYDAILEHGTASVE